MHPNELPLYENDKVDSLANSAVAQETKPSFLEMNISRSRVFVQEHSKPLQTIWSNSIDTVGSLKQNYQHLSPEINDPYTLLRNGGIITGSVVASMLLNKLFFTKSGRIRKILMPLSFGTFAAVYCYPDNALSLYRDSTKAIYQRGEQLIEKGRNAISKKRD